VILHPGILSLILGSAIVLVLVVYGGWIGIQILRRWDFSSSSEGQLELERKTSLVSTLAAYALGFQAVSTLLFLYTVDDIHALFVGAMCATGSLNAAPGGWAVLGVKSAALLLSLVWIAYNRFDQRAGDYPIVRAKYAALLALAPLVAADLALEIRYFTGLEPEVITSCCGALFSEEGTGVASEVASLPVVPMLWLFYITVAAFLAAALVCLVGRSPGARFALAGMSVALLAVVLASIVSFLSLYIYELPTHHCPFDMLQRQYRFIGYPIYLTLLAAVYFGLLPGLFQPLRRIPSLSGSIAAAEPRWLTWALVSVLAFVAIASWPVLFGSLTMMGY
jgi:hypothetical protein